MCVLKCESSDLLEVGKYVRRPYHNCYMKWFAPQCEFSYGIICHIARRKPYHIGCIEMVSAQCELSGVLQDHP